MTNSFTLRVVLPKITSIWYQSYFFFAMIFYGRLQSSVRSKGRDTDENEGLLVNNNESIFDYREAVQLPNQDRMSNAMKVQNLLSMQSVATGRLSGMGGLTADKLALLTRKSGNGEDLEDRPDNLKGTEVSVNESIKSEQILEGGE